MKKQTEKFSTIFQRLLFAGLIISACGAYSFADDITPSFIEQNRATGTREYLFTQNETIRLEENLDTTGSGTFTVKGINNSTNAIDLNSYGGFDVTQSRTFLNISNLTIKNGSSDMASAIYYAANSSSLILTNVIFENNSNISDSNALGGAIYAESAITITNTSFIGNYAQANNSGKALGGAIYADSNVNITSSGKKIKITGNYTKDSSGETNNAIYMSNDNSTLKITANNNGRIDITDNINGENGYNVTLTGDKTGTIGAYGSIENGEVSVSNVNISFSDNETTNASTNAEKTTNHKIDNLEIGNNVNFILDVDAENSKADTLTSSNATESTMKISSINVLSTSEDEKTIQILDHADNINLDITQLKNKRVSSVSGIMYNDTIIADSVSLGTTVTADDSIVIKNVKDTLYEMVKDERNSYKYFYFRTDSEYNVTKDLEELGIDPEKYPHTSSTQHLYVNYNPLGDTPNPTHQVINANGHSMFKISKSLSDIGLDNLTIKNASTNTNGSVINLANDSSTFYMRNSSELTNNHSDGKGGAIYVGKGSLTIEDSTISNNTSGDDGGAIYVNSVTSANITNTDFKNNKSDGKGGAIYIGTGTNSNLTITANNGTSTFEGNEANGENNAIYVAKRDATFTLDAKNNGVIDMNDKISGTDEKYNINITGDSSGNININNTIENAKVSAISGNVNLQQDNLLQGNDFIGKGGNLNLINNEIGETKFSNLSLTKTTNVKVDVDLAGQKMDRVTADSYGSMSGKLNVSKINLLSDTESKKLRVPFADSAMKNNVSTTVKSQTSYSRVFKYAISYDKSDGCFVFSHGGGDHPTDFNPSILSGSVGQQIAYANQLANYEYATYHVNTYMMLPRRDRRSMQNHYADKDFDDLENAPVYRNVQEEVKSIWVRPYTSFESIPLKNGPKISSINYGILAGGDSDLINLSHGFKLVYGGYFGYNGNSYHYNGINAVQQGGLIGATANIYKGNFFNTLTANIGWQINDSDTFYGSDLTNMLITGFADKFGYNIEISDGKVIIQPSLNIGYTYIGSFDYTTSSNVRVNTEPLHIMHFIPGLKIVGNTKNGWQPYAVINVVCNFGGKSHYTANNIVLPAMSINPYVEYGLGIQKRWADKYSGFAQATVRSGGRRGASLLFGFRYMLGQIAEKTANLLHADPIRKIAMFKEKKNPQIVVEPIKRWGGDKPKIAKDSSSKESKLRNILKKTKQKLCFWYKTDVSAKMVEEVYPDGVIKPNTSKKMNKQEEPSEITESITVVEKPVRLKKQFIEHKVAEQTMLEYNNKNNDNIGSLKNLVNIQDTTPSSLITEAPLFKTDAILKRHKPSNKSLYINQNNYKDYSNPKSFNDFCIELINFKF